MNNVISFPHLGDYYIPISYLVKKITNTKVIIPPKITKKTITLGAKYSPDYVCVPFKYNLGNYIEALEKGANILLQAGGGCRYGYYAELQEKILQDLGYNFTFINLIHNNHISLRNVYKFAKKCNPKLKIVPFIYYLINTALMIIIMDKLSKYPRENMGFENKKNSFKNVTNSLKRNLEYKKITPMYLIKLYKKYKKKYKAITVNKPSNCLKIGLVGELYSLMEPFCSNNIEIKLAQKGIEVHRFTTLTYLLFQKKYRLKKLLRQGKKYLKYHLGADATESIVLSEKLAKKKYDGIVHIKSFGCTPELNAMPILEKVSNDYNIPILYFSFDAQDNETAIDTRIEAFADMLYQKKEANQPKSND